MQMDRHKGCEYFHFSLLHCACDVMYCIVLSFNLGDPWESVKLTAFGWNKKIYFELLDEARHMAREKAQGRTPIYVVKGSQWEPFG